MAANTVAVDPAWVWIWRAWWRLHMGDRVWISTMGPPSPLGLSWSVVQQWADRHHYSEQDAAFLDAGVLAMDEVFLKHHAEQERIKADAGKGGKA